MTSMKCLLKPSPVHWDLYTQELCEHDQYLTRIILCFWLTGDCDIKRDEAAIPTHQRIRVKVPPTTVGRPRNGGCLDITGRILGYEWACSLLYAVAEETCTYAECGYVRL